MHLHHDMKTIFGELYFAIHLEKTVKFDHGATHGFSLLQRVNKRNHKIGKIQVNGWMCFQFIESGLLSYNQSHKNNLTEKVWLEAQQGVVVVAGVW